MSSPYQEFARQARERFLAKQQDERWVFRRFDRARIRLRCMRSIRCSSMVYRPRRCVGVIRRPKRRQEDRPRTITGDAAGISKIVAGKETWKQEVWVMFRAQDDTIRQSGWTTRAPCRTQPVSGEKHPDHQRLALSRNESKNHPIPEEILQGNGRGVF